jgi:hypothetical protein
MRFAESTQASDIETPTRADLVRPARKRQAPAWPSFSGLARIFQAD